MWEGQGLKKKVSKFKRKSSFFFHVSFFHVSNSTTHLLAPALQSRKQEKEKDAALLPWPLKISGSLAWNKSAAEFLFFMDILSTTCYCYLPTYMHTCIEHLTCISVVYSIHMINVLFVVSLFSTFNISGNGMHLKITLAQQQSCCGYHCLGMCISTLNEWVWNL